MWMIYSDLLGLLLIEWTGGMGLLQHILFFFYEDDDRTKTIWTEFLFDDIFFVDKKGNKTRGGLIWNINYMIGNHFLSPNKWRNWALLMSLQMWNDRSSIKLRCLDFRYYLLMGRNRGRGGLLGLIKRNIICLLGFCAIGQRHRL